MQEEMAKSEAQREASRSQIGMPFRFFCGVNETKQIVIVDERPSFSRHEHCLQDKRSNKWNVFVPCVDENCNCPVCKVSERPSYFAMYLTIIDLSPYINSNDEEVEFSKKLLVVKPMQQKKIMKYWERHGTLRGMILEMSRDSKKDAGIGDPEFVEFMGEEELETYVSYYVDQENVEHETLCFEPYDYEALFPPMTEDQLATLVGGGGRSNGARGADDRALGRGRGRDDDGGGDGDAWAGAAPRRVASRRGPASDEPAQDVEYQEDEPAPVRRGAPARQAAAPARQAPAPAPRGRAASAAPARAPARRSAQETIDPDDLPDAGADDDNPPFEPDPPQRASRAAPARPAPAARRAAPEPEAAAPRANVASRRAMLRPR